MRGQVVPRHVSLTMTMTEAQVLRNIIEDALALSSRQVRQGRDDWVLTDGEEELLEELRAIIAGDTRDGAGAART